jgi:hypothetical protein
MNEGTATKVVGAGPGFNQYLVVLGFSLIILGGPIEKTLNILRNFEFFSGEKAAARLAALVFSSYGTRPVTTTTSSSPARGDQSYCCRNLINLFDHMSIQSILCLFIIFWQLRTEDH